MNNSEILESAIKKACTNGYEWTHGPWLGDPYEALIRDSVYFNIIFSHDFAKAFFGRELLCYDCGEPVGAPLGNESIQIGTGTCDCGRQFENNQEAWEFHLQRMVILEDPIQYLKQFLDE